MEAQMSVFKKIGAGLVSVVLVAGAELANATGDAGTVAVPTDLASAATSVLGIGAAVFSIAIAIKVYKWVRRAL